MTINILWVAYMINFLSRTGCIYIYIVVLGKESWSIHINALSTGVWSPIHTYFLQTWRLTSDDLHQQTASMVDQKYLTQFSDNSQHASRSFVQTQVFFAMLSRVTVVTFSGPKICFSPAVIGPRNGFINSLSWDKLKTLSLLLPCSNLSSFDCETGRLALT